MTLEQQEKPEVEPDPGGGLNFSVVIPNRNGGKTLDDVLRAVFAAGPPPFEVIVVDDSSTDGSLEIARRYPVALIAQDACRGASSARNAGAAAARGNVIVFIDNDVIIPPETFRILEEHFKNPAISGVVGLLRPVTPHRNFSSQYKSFYMHYTYMKLPERATVFYTSIAAIRKEAFEDCAGFDTSYAGATIEDMDFGLRVTGRGYRLVMDKRLQVEHLKYYTLKALLKTGFRRAAGLARIMIRDRMRRKKQSTYHTTPASFTGGIVLAYLSLLFLVLGAIGLSSLWLLLAALAYGAVVVLNFGMLRGLARHTRPLYFFLGCGFIFPDLLAHGLGVIWGAVSYLLGDKY